MSGPGVGAAAYGVDMTSDDAPWEPPLAGTDAEQLLGSLDRLRATFRWKSDDLDSAGLHTTVGASTLTLGGLLKHLALVEEHYSTGKLAGEPLGPPWDGVDWDADPDWEFTSAADDAPEDLYALYDGAVARSRARSRRRSRAPVSTRRRTCPAPRDSTRASGGCCSTSWRSTAATRATPT